ncbi:unnamed protein product [Urochloa humidicola]
MASAAAPTPLPVASLSARRSATASRAVAAAAPRPLGFPRRFKPSAGGAPRSSLRAAASSSKVDPVEERTPVAPLADVAVPADDASSPAPSLEPPPQVSTGTWKWRGYNIRYQHAGTSGPALVLIHGFGANSDHWRKNIPVLAMTNRVYAIDLIGYGYSDKPNPREIRENFYTFETWGEQLNTFCAEVVRSEAFFICNSIGGLVGLQAAVMEPQKCKGIVLLDISLRMLHIKKQPWNTIVGKLFFNAVATPESVKNILCQCYHDTSAVTDELVQIILQPGLDPGAVDVFLEFICYSGGPLPEELLPLVKCPVLVAWGEDPWEPVELGRAYASFDTVEDFVVLPDVGHCPQDEAPELVNPLVQSFVQHHS